MSSQPEPPVGGETRGQQASTRGGGELGPRSLVSLFGPAVLSSLSASVLGFVFWVLAAHLYLPRLVGSAGSTISLASGIGVAASGGLYAVLLRSLSLHSNPRRLLWVTCGCVALNGGIVGLIAGLLHLSRAPIPVPWLSLSVVSAIWALFVLQDSILISLRRTSVLFASNVGFGAVKLVLLIALAGSSLGILNAWVIPLVIVVPVVGWFADRSVLGISPIQSAAFTVTPGHVASEYASSLAAMAVFGGTPVIVSVISGGAFTGIVYVCWMLYISADSVGIILSNAAVSSATDQGLDTIDAVRSARQVIPLVLGMLAVGIVVAPWVLEIFGHEYEAGSALLRLLWVGVMIRMIGHLSLGARRVKTDFTRVAVAQGCCAIITCAGVAAAASEGSMVGIGASLIAGSVIMTLVAISPDVIEGLRRKRL